MKQLLSAFFIYGLSVTQLLLIDIHVQKPLDSRVIVEL